MKSSNSSDETMVVLPDDGQIKNSHSVNNQSCPAGGTPESLSGDSGSNEGYDAGHYSDGEVCVPNDGDIGCEELMVSCTVDATQ